MNKPVQTLQTPLSDQHEALELYLNALLSEIEETCDQEIETDSIESLAEKTATLDQTMLQGDGDLPVTDELPVENIAAPVSEETFEVHVDHELELIPRWAKTGFQVLSFNLGGNLCSVTVNLIAGIIPTPSVLTYLPGQAPWLMGLHRHKDSTINVFDLGMIIGQTQHQAVFKSGAAIPNGYIVLIGDGRWGFVIKKLEKMITLFSDDVKWRCNRSQTDIAIGTISQNMSTLLDIEVLLKAFNVEL